MRAILAGLLPAVVGGLVIAGPAPASERQLALRTMEELQVLDPVVAGVRGRILSALPHQSGCGRIDDGDLVALYCLVDRAIYITEATLARVRSAFGVVGVRYVVAHEMAHGRQHAVTGFASGLVWTSVLDELQADCIAGAYLQRLDGLQLDSEETRQLQRFAYSIGDRSFHQRDWHGNPRLRVAALNRGLRTGEPARCLSSSRFNYSNLLEQGSNWLQRLRQR